MGEKQHQRAPSFKLSKPKLDAYGRPRYDRSDKWSRVKTRKTIPAPFVARVSLAVSGGGGAGYVAEAGKRLARKKRPQRKVSAHRAPAW